MRYLLNRAAIGLVFPASLAMFGTVFNPGSALAQDAASAAQGAAPVRITGPLPLPVTGSTTVSGPVAVKQDGVWTVNIRNLDEPGRAPFQAQITASATSSPTLSGIPAGKRLVIQHVSANLITPSTTGGYLRMGITPPAGSAFGGATYQFPLTFVGTRSPVGSFFVGSFPVTAYADPDSVIQFLTDSGFISSGTLFIAVSGYLVDCSVAQSCSAAP
jgi:hypothetical protein